MFTLNNVSKSYGGETILHNISCQIPSDAFVFIIGPSGSGKSTLLRLLGQVESPDAGKLALTLDGTDYQPGGLQCPWPKLTCVFQRQFLWPHLTLRENISLPLRLRRAQETEGRLQAVIDLFEMNRFVDRYPNEVSGGQAQRAALARALALDPKIILIDEAHGGLDLEQQARLNQHLLQLRQSEVGLVVVTHSMEFVERYADLIIVVEDGTVAEMGHKGILKSPKSNFLKAVVSRP